MIAADSETARTGRLSEHSHRRGGTVPHRRDFLKTLAAGAAGACATGRGYGPASALAQATRPRRQVTVAGRPVTVIDVHAHCVIPVEDIVKGTPLAERGGGGNGVLGPARLAGDGRAGRRRPDADHQRLLVVHGRSRAGRPDRVGAERGTGEWVAAHPDRFVGDGVGGAAASRPRGRAARRRRQAARAARRVDRRPCERRGPARCRSSTPSGPRRPSSACRCFMHPGGAENIIRDGRAARPRRPRQHHRQPARDDLLPVAADLRRHARPVSRPAACARRTPAATCRPIWDAPKRRASVRAGANCANKKTPSEYLKTQILIDTMIFSREKGCGTWSTSWRRPDRVRDRHPVQLAGHASTWCSNAPFLSDADKEAILGGNAKRLFRM